MSGTKIAVDVEGRQVVLSNLDKVLYPAVGFTKGQVLDYYTRIAPVLLPHLAGRALTRKRYPDGVEGQVFFEKNAPRGTPDWVRTVTLPTPGLVEGPRDDRLRRRRRPRRRSCGRPTSRASSCTRTCGGSTGDAPDLVVFDLDPGPPATVVECCRVALLLRPLLEADGLVPFAKTSRQQGPAAVRPRRRARLERADVGVRQGPRAAAREGAPATSSCTG